jgi:hypothetical protein
LLVGKLIEGTCLRAEIPGRRYSIRIEFPFQAPKQPSTGIETANPLGPDCTIFAGCVSDLDQLFGTIVDHGVDFIALRGRIIGGDEAPAQSA